MCQLRYMWEPGNSGGVQNTPTGFGNNLHTAYIHFYKWYCCVFVYILSGWVLYIFIGHPRIYFSTVLSHNTLTRLKIYTLILHHRYCRCISPLVAIISYCMGANYALYNTAVHNEDSHSKGARNRTYTYTKFLWIAVWICPRILANTNINHALASFINSKISTPPAY